MTTLNQTGRTSHESGAPTTTMNDNAWHALAHVGKSHVAHTMSSREIADLTGSTHDNVLKTIRGVVGKGVVSANETPYIHPQNGQTYHEFLLGFRDTMVIVSGTAGRSLNPLPLPPRCPTSRTLSPPLVHGPMRLKRSRPSKRNWRLLRRPSNSWIATLRRTASRASGRSRSYSTRKSTRSANSSSTERSCTRLAARGPRISAILTRAASQCGPEKPTDTPTPARCSRPRA